MSFGSVGKARKQTPHDYGSRTDAGLRPTVGGHLSPGGRP